jgi:hypothetical protein
MVNVLPNSLTKDNKVDWSMSIPGREWMYLYCASCGGDMGRVLKAEIPNVEEYAGALCDPCAEKYGNIPGAWAIPDALFWQKVKEAQIEHHHRELTAKEVLKELDDPNSYHNKLVRDRNTFLASE